MMKFFGFLSLLVLSIGSMAQEQVHPVRSMYVQDQRDRGVPYADNGHDMLSDADAKKIPVYSWDDIGKRDEARRAATAKLLQDGKLKTAEDFAEAAMIFQHGSTEEDYLLAHVLAMDAIAKGDTSAHARGLAAVTLDRYLQRAGKKQVFGTQYLGAQYSFMLQHANDKNLDEEVKKIPESKQTQEPYDQTLVPDAVRADFCVAPQQAQKDYITAANAGKELDLPKAVQCR